jgi:hypothetical protein
MGKAVEPRAADAARTEDEPVGRNVVDTIIDVFPSRPLSYIFLLNYTVQHRRSQYVRTLTPTNTRT